MDCTANPLVDKKMSKSGDQQEPKNSILMSLDVLNDFQKIIMERKKNNPTQQFLDESLSMIVNAKKIFTDKIPAPKKNELRVK